MFNMFTLDLHCYSRADDVRFDVMQRANDKIQKRWNTKLIKLFFNIQVRNCRAEVSWRVDVQYGRYMHMASKPCGPVVLAVLMSRYACRRVQKHPSGNVTFTLWTAFCITLEPRGTRQTHNKYVRKSRSHLRFVTIRTHVQTNMHFHKRV